MTTGMMVKTCLWGYGLPCMRSRLDNRGCSSLSCSVTHTHTWLLLVIAWQSVCNMLFGNVIETQSFSGSHREFSKKSTVQLNNGSFDEESGIISSSLTCSVCRQSVLSCCVEASHVAHWHVLSMWSNVHIQTRKTHWELLYHPCCS